MTDQCTTDQRPTSGHSHTVWKISSGHNSAMHHPIRFVFGSKVGFSAMADRTALFPVGQNPRWRLASILKTSNGHISAMHNPIPFMYTDHTLLWHYNDCWRIWKEIGCLFRKEGNWPTYDTKREWTGRFGEIDEKITRKVYTLDSSQSKVFLVFWLQYRHFSNLCLSRW